MAKKVDLTGKRFGRLLVIGLDHLDKRRGKYYLCKCDCGNEKITMGSNLTNGGTKSCGCLQKENTSKRASIDLLGQKFGRLEVIKFVGVDKNHTCLWLCRCDCGNEKIVEGSNLRNGHTQSCNCLRYEKVAEKKRFKFGESCLNSLYGRYKDSAKKRGLIFDLSKDIFKQLTKQDCFYCGKEPSQIVSQKGFYGKYVYNGIDRVDNSLGYILDNVVS
jgi:hypothetical protein